MFSKFFKTIIPIFWMGLIFYLSSQPREFFFEVTIDKVDIIIHIFLYAVLALLLSSAAAGWGKERRIINIWAFSVLFSIFYGASDEYHQSFIPGRAAAVADLVFDAIGAILGASAYYFMATPRKKKILIHICCVGCGAYVVSELKKEFRTYLFFYNPNIFPFSEYEKRLNEARKVARDLGLPLIIGDYEHQEWLELVHGHEQDKERGERCLICYRERLKRTAEEAAQKGFDYFGTTLTVSPHKDASALSRIGNELAFEYGIKFFDNDFKKQDGFKKACELSKELGLYRQEYCGCEFSRRETRNP